ncbi:MAG TPA: hypothetical protein VIL55_07255 [Naasia sp.]
MITYLLCQPDAADPAGEHRITVAFAELAVARRYFDSLPIEMRVHAHLEAHEIGTPVLLHQLELIPA